ncbi:hypothetical protein N7533_010583 [Penicillium manginii]|uniref:uncharacterized protein n=1 Tax=Penicillium manginii TaxID=203109 RepID=UPI002548E7C4|nr:uncharacterized protein N7533_010583 [Penicillium manginii]KAJ5743481.1 hypothetical protein N7533_010583 [Penicillium manginii]
MKSHIPQHYSVGLWSYCTSGHNPESTCSDPSLTFAFNLSSTLSSTVAKMEKVLQPVGESTISGYRQISHAIIYLYISSLVGNTLVTALGIQKTFFDRGDRLLSILNPLSALFITTATVGVTVMYGLFVTEVKAKLSDIGVKAILGSRLFGAAWLAVFLSIGSSIIWLIQLFCCCI